MFWRAYRLGLSKLLTLVYSRQKDPRITNRGVVAIIINEDQRGLLKVIIKSTNSDSKATIEGFDNIVLVRNSLDEAIRIVDKQRLRKSKRKKK